MVIKGQLQEAGGDGQIQWSSNGEILTASAGVKATPGSWKQLRGVVIDARDGELPFTVRVEVTASTRPTITVKPDVIENAVAGQRYDLQVTGNDTSHLLGDQSVTLLSARATSPGGSVTVTDAARGMVSVTLAAGWHGPFTANYYVNDATGDPNRQVTGSIMAQVRDRPGAPLTPTRPMRRCVTARSPSSTARRATAGRRSSAHAPSQPLRAATPSPAPVPRTPARSPA
ncbi:Ig-like domain-containing protein [Tessaracoccus coleopterorum]|uniref:Ig-like domain-containing protein n=1 Tax=Tessaracoccus coleopterorum TaxID=2714950 RepID=UPI001E3B7985|nr:hypothetical protein [Tessaracoccus coleopterorum]